MKRASRKRRADARSLTLLRTTSTVLILRSVSAVSKEAAGDSGGASWFETRRSLSSSRALRGPVGAPRHEELPFTAEEIS
jgi:hypothetical protein